MDSEGKLVVLRIENLILDHRELRREQVDGYVRKYCSGVQVAPVECTYCVHNGHHHLSDGHHRVAALVSLGRSSVLSKVDLCTQWGCKGVEGYGFNVRHQFFEEAQL